jgi:hypothetical protein
MKFPAGLIVVFYIFLLFFWCFLLRITKLCRPATIPLSLEAMKFLAGLMG